MRNRICAPHLPCAAAQPNLAVCSMSSSRLTTSWVPLIGQAHISLELWESAIHFWNSLNDSGWFFSSQFDSELYFAHASGWCSSSHLSWALVHGPDAAGDRRG